MGDEVDADARYVPCDGHAQPAAESSQATRLVDIPTEVKGASNKSKCSELTELSMGPSINDDFKTNGFRTPF